MLRIQQASTDPLAKPANPQVSGESLPLSSAQQRLWFLDRLEPNTALYASPTRIWLRGPLDVQALEWAVESTVRRHEILRTVYGMEEETGQPYQVVTPAGLVSIERVSLAQVREEEREKSARTLSGEFGNRTFDLAAGPVMRSQLIELDPEWHLLTISIHHIAGDGWSLGILCRELAAYYAERALGLPARMQELPLQYADYAVWQCEQLKTREMRGHLEFWRDKLAGSPGSVPLPTDFPRPAAPTFRGNVCRRRIPADLRDRLYATARRDEATPFMVVLAAFQTLLYGYSGTEDIAVGSPVANRNRIELEGLIGCFINTVVLRTRFKAEGTFRELLRHTRETVLQAFEHQQVPFEAVISELHPARTLSASPLFNVLFVFHNFRFQHAQAGPLAFRLESAFTETAKFDLTLFTVAECDYLEFLLEYNCDLFKPATADRMLEDLELVVAAASSEPDASLTKLTQTIRRVASNSGGGTSIEGGTGDGRRRCPSQGAHGSAVERLSKVWQELLRVSKVGEHENFFELGGDSILSIQIIAKARKLGLQLTPKQVFQHQTIAELAAVATEIRENQQPQGLRDESFPLTPIQRWFVHQFPTLENHWNQALEFELAPEITPDLVRLVLRTLLRNHAALRLRFARAQAGWRQSPMSATDVLLDVIDLQRLPVREGALVKANHIQRMQAALNPESGCVMRAALFQAAPGSPGHLVLAIHHLVVDSVSWQILVEDFEDLCANMLAGRPFELPAPSTSYQDWSARLQDYANSDAVLGELPYWTSIPTTAVLLPADFETGAGGNTEASAVTITTQLSETVTLDLLHRVPPIYRTHINDVLLAALALATAKRSSVDSVLLFMEGHGREMLWGDVDLSRTVGWFTSLFPVFLRIPPGGDRGEMLRSVKEQLRKIPNHGLGYGVLRYLRGQAETQLLPAFRPQLLFNYLGQLDQTLNGRALRLSRIHMETARHPQALRPTQLEVNASVVASRLRLDWTYSSNLHHQTTVEEFALLYLDCLRSIINHCLGPEAGGSTPSDFALAGLSQKELDQIYSQFGEK